MKEKKRKNRMLSVQSPGYAGMGQRLGTPGGAAAGGAERHRQCRDINDLSLQNMASLQLSREYSRLVEMHARTRGVQQSEALNCPPRIALPDGEQRQDRYLQLRVDYQQAELTRSAIRPPPNKSVQDVPDWAPPQPPAAQRKPSAPSKKDGFVQKAVKYLVGKASFSGGKGTETAAETPAPAATAPTEPPRQRPPPCVMVPLRPPPAPAPPPPAPPAPPSPPHAPS